ncbi:hypothetical protein [Micromonospora sp. NPDC050200]|uniref:hypothetical protein n=1 Tax=Micromonospora sp. NPDC050200 TaxID=3155664 RepID=UPI00340287EE
MTLPTWLIEVIDAAQPYAQHIAVGAGAVGALLALILLWRFVRRGHAHVKLGRVAVTLATLFAMEGMYEVAHGPLGLNVAGSLMFCATFEVVMLHQGSLAAHKLAAHYGGGPAPDISRHMRFVWLVAGASGVIASTASDSVTEVVLRLATPPLAAGIWYMSLYADRVPAERQPSAWIWTPQRIGVRLGLLKPGAVDDLGEVFRQRRIAALVDAGMELQAARLRQGEPAAPSRWRIRRQRDPLAAAHRRIQRLTKTASAQDVADARVQLRRVLTVEHELFRDDSQPTQRERELMDELRLVVRQASDRVRAEHAAAFAPAAVPGSMPSRREPLVELGGIRMPAHVAARIDSPAQREPRRESLPARATVRRTVTEPVGEPDPSAGNARLAEAHARLTERLGREPSGAKLGAEAGVSKATANRWKSGRTR